MALNNSFERAIAYWSFGWLPSDRLPDVAADALGSGLDSSSLVALASSEKTPNPELHTMFEAALAELGRQRLTKVEAGRLIAKDYAQKICDGQLDAIEGARLIWKVSLESDELGSELGIFGGRVTEYEGMPELRDREAAMILEEAQALIGD
jgi:hypothetical protein